VEHINLNIKKLKTVNTKRIILVGPSCAGKNYIRDKFKEKKYEIDISYTSREPRPGEEEGVDYYFLSKEKFEQRIKERDFYEHVKYGDCYYGTGIWEWNNCEVFIMETDGVSKIAPEDRPYCLIIYVNTPLMTRVQRMRERGWDEKKIMERAKIDIKRFKDFKDYDIQISSESQ
jgi:guanylate kinase